MLNLCYGIDWQENRRWLLRQICARADAGQGGSILVTPEQFSHDAERCLCQAGGDQISRYAEVLSFSRLADRVFSVCGGAADVTMDRGGRLLAMASAVGMVRSRLKVYGASGEKPEFLLQALETLDECKAFCLPPEALRQASAMAQGAFSVKLEELALLAESYEAACENGTHDAASRLLQLLDALASCDYDRDKTFFFDGFSDFNGLELRVIQQLLADGCSVTMTLLCDDLQDGQDVFDGVRDTALQLAKAAGRAGCSVATQKLAAAPVCPAAEHLRRNLFAGRLTEFAEKGDYLQLYEAEDPYEEVAALTGQLLRQVQSGYRFRDLSVVCGDMYQPILQAAFARCHIPAYYAGTDEILAKPVIQTVLFALQAATGDMEQEEVFAYLKSGLSPVSRDACDRLENYVFTWNISGSGWQSPWTMHPDGFGKPWDDRSRRQLDMLNQDRQQAAAPLLRLRQAIRQAKNSGEQVLALYDFLEDISFSERMRTLAERLAAEGNLQGAQEYAQLYQILVSALEQFYHILGTTVRSGEEFYRLMRALLSQYDVGTIPAAMDCVRVGSVMSMRQSAARCRYVIGACDGLLPTEPAQSGLWSEEDRKCLRRLGLDVASGAPEKLGRELHGIYNVLTSAHSSLYLSAVRGRPAYLFQRLEEMFPHAHISPSTLPEVVLRSREAALEYLAQAGSDRSRQAQLEPLAQCLPEQAQTLQAVLAQAAYQSGPLSRDTVTALYGQTLSLSASKIDRLAKCRFAYFLEYGLRARERKRASFDASLYGEFVHYVLEHTARQTMAEGGFHVLPEGRVLELAEGFIHQYTQEVLPDLEGRPERLGYLYRRNLQEITEVVKDLCRELQVSDFEPAFFELEFRKGAEMPSVQVVGQYIRGEMVGKVDRVDLCRIGQTTYARVVDYKTGKKDFDYTDLLSGIGLQMLIYLFALEQGSRQSFGIQVQPSGVLYMPARCPVERMDYPPTEEEEPASRSVQRRKGLLLNDDAVLQAMERNEKTSFLPAKTTKDGEWTGDLASREQLAALRQFVERSLAGMADQIALGDLTPNPYYRGERENACQYCPYQTVCHVKSGAVAHRARRKKDIKEFWNEVEEERNG